MSCAVEHNTAMLCGSVLHTECSMKSRASAEAVGELLVIDVHRLTENMNVCTRTTAFTSFATNTLSLRSHWVLFSVCVTKRGWFGIVLGVG